MAGTFTAKVFAQGRLPAVTGALATVPAGRTWYVRFFRCFNTAPGVESVETYVDVGSVRGIGAGDVAPKGRLDIVDKDDGLVLNAGHKIEGKSSTNGVVDYVIAGVEET